MVGRWWETGDHATGPCRATRADWLAGRPLAEIRTWHCAKGWRDIGYHWVIDRDGKVLEWLLDQAADLPMGQRLRPAARAMLPYVNEGAGDALKRFGRSQDAWQHLQDMARAELIKQLGSVAPDKLSEALAQATIIPAR